MRLIHVLFYGFTCLMVANTWNIATCSPQYIRLILLTLISIGAWIIFQSNMDSNTRKVLGTNLILYNIFAPGLQWARHRTFVTDLGTHTSPSFIPLSCCVRLVRANLSLTPQPSPPTAYPSPLHSHHQLPRHHTNPTPSGGRPPPLHGQRAAQSVLTHLTLPNLPESLAV